MSRSPRPAGREEDYPFAPPLVWEPLLKVRDLPRFFCRRPRDPWYRDPLSSGLLGGPGRGGTRVRCVLCPACVLLWGSCSETTC